MKNFILCFIAITIFFGCASDAEIKRNELTLWARNPEIPNEEVEERLLAILEDRDECPHYRATAAKLLGEMQSSKAVEPLFRILGENVTEPEKFEFLRKESASALGSLGDASIYRRMMFLLYSLASWEISISVRRFFIQSFKEVPNFKDNYSITSQQAFSVEILAEMLRTAQTKKENQSLIYRITAELQRISGTPELTQNDVSAWEQVAIQMRRNIQN